MRGVELRLALMAALLMLTCARARAESLIRTVPEGATLEYRVGGQVVQSVPLRAGTYRITVEEIPTRTGPHIGHGRRK